MSQREAEEGRATDETKAQRKAPSRLVLETSTRCNLSCPACPRQSAGYGGSDLDFDLALLPALDSAFPSLESLVLNGIGEPLLHPELLAIIRRARSRMPPEALIGFQTNGQLLDPAKARDLIAAGLSRAWVSVDALDEGLFASLRAGGRSEAAWKAVSLLDQARAETPSSGFRVGIEFVASRSNLEELPALVARAAESGVDEITVSQLFPYESGAMDDAVWDANLDLARDLRDEFAARARARGLDLFAYRSVFMKYEKSPEEKELVALAQELQAEALARGVTVNLERLLGQSEPPIERALRAFEEAGRLAKSAGIALDLPALVPRSRRRCEFVEGGTAFISASGEVHPCYFLWHRYECHAGGWEKKVAPRSFGSLRDRDMLSIWRDPGFAAFRANVTRYDYPYCLNCNLALCDYVSFEDFEQDCHINAEPCAVCLWCQGLFRCMF